MQLEEYFDFQRPDDIRLKGSRIGIETVLYEYIHRARTPEEIADTYRTLTLEQVYATILYYLHNKEAVTKYLEDWLEYCHRSEKERQQNPTPGMLRMRQLRAEIKTRGMTVTEWAAELSEKGITADEWMAQSAKAAQAGR